MEWKVTVAGLSVTEYAVLGVLAEQPSHGFAIAKELAEGGEVGRILTVGRPLVYRALDRLVEGGFATVARTEQDAGPRRVVYRVTEQGRRRLQEWLAEPVGHVRDMRIDLLLKLALLCRSEVSPIALIRAQKLTLRETLAALGDTGSADHVELWRQHNAMAAAAYLDDLEHLYDRA